MRGYQGQLLVWALTLTVGSGTTNAAPTVESEPATFEVVVGAAPTESSARVYVALTSPDVAWRQPRAEVVANAGQGAVALTVPAGTYRWLVGAPGAALQVGDPVTLTAGATHREIVTLEPLSAIEGSVIDTSGTPVAGAVVGHLRAFSDNLSGGLSEQARAALLENYRVSTTENGAFRVPVAAGWRHFVWIEKPGFAPTTLRDVLVKEKSIRVPAVELKPGAGLVVRWPKKRDEGLRLELRPIDTEWFDKRGLGRGWLLWDREVAGRAQSWLALPPGAYELWVKGPAAGGHEIVPQRLVERIELAKRKTATIDVMLPTIAMLEASSVPSALVQVLSGDDGRGVPKATLSAIAETDVDAFMKARRQGETSDVRTTDEQGWARFPSLPSGILHFLVVTDSQAWPHLSQPFEFKHGQELAVEIELPVPGTIEVIPAISSALEKELAGVQILLSDASGEHGKRWRSRSSVLDETSTASFEGVPPGPWRVSAIVEMSDGLKHPIAGREVELSAGATERVDLDLEASFFRGRITYLGEGVKASIHLRSTESGPSARTYSDEDGNFMVPLAEPGWYAASASGEALAAIAELGEVHFEDPTSEIELELPAGRILGQVVDSEGTPVPAASVQGRAFDDAQHADGNTVAPRASIRRLGTKSDAGGHFVFEMVSVGTWSLQAERAGDKSAAKTVELVSDADERTVELVVVEKSVLTGRVVDTTGVPRVGVRIGISPLTIEGVPSRYSSTTDSEGRFEISAQDLEGKRANITASDPQGVQASARVDLVTQNLTVVVPPIGGRVELRRSDAWPTFVRPPASFALVASDGAYVFLAPPLARPSLDDAGVWEVVGLAPGWWTLVHLETAHHLTVLASGNAASLAGLARFEVRAGGDDVIEVK